MLDCVNEVMTFLKSFEKVDFCGINCAISALLFLMLSSIKYLEMFLLRINLMAVF